MSVNKYKPHVYVLPEDDADRQIANGFILHQSVRTRQIQVVAPAGGWSRVLETFQVEYLTRLQQNSNAHVVLLIDFDGNPQERQERFSSEIPDSVHSRVFVIGPRDTPEKLRQSLNKPYEDIGQSLAHECDSDTVDIWAHEHLQHNEIERCRLLDSVKSFLFNSVL